MRRGGRSPLISWYIISSAPLLSSASAARSGLFPLIPAFMPPVQLDWNTPAARRRKPPILLFTHTQDGKGVQNGNTVAHYALSFALFSKDND
jgi:hypothetical protein